MTTRGWPKAPSSGLVRVQPDSLLLCALCVSLPLGFDSGARTGKKKISANGKKETVTLHLTADQSIEPFPSDSPFLKNLQRRGLHHRNL